MTRKSIGSLLVAFVLGLPGIYAQEGYKIDFKIKGLQDTVIYLGHTFWESTFVADTAKVKNGVFSFDGKKKLGPGEYMLITKGTGGNVRIFDFVLGDDQIFSIETTKDNPVLDAKITGDIDNKLFHDYAIFSIDRRMEAEPFIKVLRDSAISEGNKMVAQTEYNKIGEKVKAYQTDLIKKNPKAVITRIIRANQNVEVPESPLLPNGKKDETFAYKYYKAHYWDNFDLADEALLRLSTPLFKEKLKFYLDKMVVQNPDSIIKEIDAMAAIARKNKEAYKFVIWKTITEYQMHSLMGMDAVYVHLSDKYIASGELDYWINETVKKNVIEIASQYRRSLIGQQAKNLIMQDQNLKPQSMFDVAKKYTLLFIFDPDCPHCREETPKLVDFYNKFHTKYDLEVFAVCSDSSMKKMKNFIKEMNTPWITVNGPRSYVGSYDNFYDAKMLPSLYIIDEKKKIIAKKPPIESLENFLNHHEKMRTQP